MSNEIQLIIIDFRNNSQNIIVKVKHDVVFDNKEVVILHKNYSIKKNDIMSKENINDIYQKVKNILKI